MNSKNITEISKNYQKRLQNIETETLELIYKDHAKAVEYAKKGIEAVEPEKKSDSEYVETVARELQSVSLMLLKERGLK